MKHLSGTAWIRGFLRRVPLSQAGPEVLTLKSPTPGHLNSQVEGSPVLAIPLGIWQWLGFAHSGSPPQSANGLVVLSPPAAAGSDLVLSSF